MAARTSERLAFIRHDGRQHFRKRSFACCPTGRASSIAARRTAAGQFEVIRGDPRAVDTYAIGTPIGPLRIACTQKIAQLLSSPGEIRLAEATVSSDEPSGQTVRALLRQICGQLFLQHRSHTGVRRRCKPCRPACNACATGEIRYQQSCSGDARDVQQTYSQTIAYIPPGGARTTQSKASSGGTKDHVVGHWLRHAPGPCSAKTVGVPNRPRSARKHERGFIGQGWRM